MTPPTSESFNNLHASLLIVPSPSSFLRVYLSSMHQSNCTVSETDAVLFFVSFLQQLTPLGKFTSQSPCLDFIYSLQSILSQTLESLNWFYLYPFQCPSKSTVSIPQLQCFFWVLHYSFLFLRWLQIFESLSCGREIKLVPQISSVEPRLMTIRYNR